MARGGPRKAGGPSKKGAKASVTLLHGDGLEESEIPAMPDPTHWIAPPRAVHDQKSKADKTVLENAGIDPEYHEPDDPIFDDIEVDWVQPVKDWWVSIWTSPMQKEFADSDIHGLYLGCYYLHESLNPFYKLSDRIAAAKAFENVQQKYGLNPSAREQLRWQVMQGASAENRTNQIRAASGAGKESENKKTGGKNGMSDFYSQFGS